MRPSGYWRRLAGWQLSRRRLLRAGAAAGLGVAGLGLAACGDDKEEGVLEGTATPTAQGEVPMREELVPSNDEIYGWIEQIFAQGVRRPGYPADRWTEQFCLERFRDFGLENVRTEPVELPYWEPRQWSLTVWAEGSGAEQALHLDCFPLPHAAPTRGLEGQIVPFEAESPERVKGSIALCDLALMRVPHATLAGMATWSYDPDATFADSVQVLPFGSERQAVMQRLIAADAVAFVGTLTD